MLTALHGFTETDETWPEVLGGGFAGLRCPLLPGHGWKPCPAGLDLAGLAGGIAADMPSGSDLLGYSMGGRAALRLALDHPGRVRRLVLVSGGPGFREGPERAQRRGRDEALAQILEEDGIGPFVSWWEQNPILRTAVAPSGAEAQRLRARRLNQDPLGLAAALRGCGAGAMDPLWDRLPGLRAPTLLVAGAADTRYVQVMGEMAALIPGARLQVVPAAGHAVHRERPAELAAVLRSFLAG